MLSVSTSHNYTPLPMESPSLPHRQSPPIKPSQKRNFRRFACAAILLLVAVIGFGGWDAHRPDSRTQKVLQSTGLVRPDRPLGKASRQNDLVSVVLMVGKNDHGVLEVVRSILSTTVGPYELIGVFTEPQDQSQRIVSILTDHHLEARVDRHGRGLRRYTAINATQRDELPLMQAVKRVRGKYMAIINADDQMVEYGWDRILLTGVKSEASLLAVSGRAAANAVIDDNEMKLSNRLGDFKRSDQTARVKASVSHVDIRDIAFRSPIMYNVKIGESIGWMDESSETAGLGDADMCFRGHEAGYFCGYYPVAIKGKEEWKTVLGSFPVSGAEGTIKLDENLATSFAEVMRHERPSHALIPATPREIEDIPKTIVTAFSGNHQRTVQQWYNSLHHSPHTRFIAYILPSDVSVDPSSVSEWENVEIREFDFSRWPSWMDVTHNRGEYAWKDLIVEEVVRDYGGLVFWMDSGDELTDDFTRTWQEVAEQGMYAVSVGGPIWMWLHPAAVAYLSYPSTLMDNTNCNGAMWGVNAQHYDAMNKIIRPLFDCAKTRECIAPLGSDRTNHRQDQAALTALIHLSGYKCDSHPPIRMAGDAPGDGSKFCSDGREC